MCLASSSREGDVLGILVSGSNLHTHQIGRSGGRCAWHQVVGRAVCVASSGRSGGRCVWHRVVGRAMCLASSSREGDVLGIY